MTTARLGRRLLKDLAPVARATTIYDSELKGFGLKVLPPSARNAEGARSWIVEYRPGSGGRGVAKRRVVLGSTGALSPEQAREAAKTMLAAVRLGADPSAARAESRAAKNLGELVPLYQAATDPLRKPRTVELYEGLWRNHVVPKFGASPAAAVTKPEIVRLHRAIGVTKQSTANRVVKLLSHFYGWAAEEGFVPPDFNPARGVDKYRESGRERYLTEAEMGRLGAAIRLAETEGVPWVPSTGRQSKHQRNKENRKTIISPQCAGAIRLLILTGARLREILHLEWSQVDFGRGMIFLTDSKTGKKPILLGGGAIAVLTGLKDLAVAEAQRLDPRANSPLSKFVFATGDMIRPRHDLKRPWALVRRAAELPDLRLHDLRHSFASVGAGFGLGLPVIGKLLGHGDVKTTARYAHLDADPLRRANDMIGAAIARAMEGGAQ